MSNNAPDYDDNLVFPPRHDKTAYELQIENSKLKEQLAEHKENCCCAKNEVLLLEINRLRNKIKLLKSALRYGNSTSKLVLELIKPISYLDKNAIVRDFQKMISKITEVLNDESEEK